MEPKPLNIIVNSNMNGYLRQGEEYKVYGIRCSPEIIYYMIFDGQHLVEVPLELFEIVDHKVPYLWEIRNVGNEITLWPELFYNEDFFENFSDWNDKERNEFSQIKGLI